MKKLLKVFGVVWLVVLVILVIILVMKKPSHDKNWSEAMVNIPEVVWQGKNIFQIKDLRDFVYDAENVLEQNWVNETFDADKLERAWFSQNHFGGWRGIAHTFLVFEFVDGDEKKYLSLSVEARREEGEKYSPWKGLLNKYELMYLWSTEKDILTRRAVWDKRSVYQYELVAEKSELEFLLKDLLETTNDIYKKPRFYNTLKHNCTNELAKSANGAGTFSYVPRHYSFLFTGFSDKYLYDLGYIKNDLSFVDEKEESDITNRIKELDSLDSDDFSKQLHKYSKDFKNRGNSV